MKVIFLSNNGRHHKKIEIKLWSHIVFPLFLLCLLVVIALSSSLIFNKNKLLNNESILHSRFDVLLKKVDRLELLINNEADLVKGIQESEARLAKQKVGFNYGSSLGVNKPDRKDNNVKVVGFYSSPVKNGYVSSNYGQRRDPLNGHKKHHNGIDIAAIEGSNIHAIASGFVTFSGKKGGYGNVIEIHHSDSLKSRYAHLKDINIEKGDVVRKGEIIATMGKTGRATGSHLHLEVWKNKQAVDPKSFIDTAISNLSRL